jgi:hypothetical protein
LLAERSKSVFQPTPEHCLALRKSLLSLYNQEEKMNKVCFVSPYAIGESPNGWIDDNGRKALMLSGRPYDESEFGFLSHVLIIRVSWVGISIYDMSGVGAATYTTEQIVDQALAEEGLERIIFFCANHPNCIEQARRLAAGPVPLTIVHCEHLDPEELGGEEFGNCMKIACLDCMGTIPMTALVNGFFDTGALVTVDKELFV